MAVTTRRHQITQTSAPFGHPDGAKGDLKAVQANFIDFSRTSISGGLASRPDDRTVRVLVGRKGVGKTIYLRRFQASASDEHSVFAAEREADPPATEDVLRVGQEFNPDTVTETWQLIWRRGIERSVVSRLLCTPILRDNLDAEVRTHLTSDFEGLVPAVRTPRPVYAEVSDILRSFHTAHKLNDQLKAREWVELEYWIERALRDVAPIYLYIDAVDDHFQRAPMYWLKCQKGLFLEVMAMLEREVWDRLHVVVSVRDLVLSSVLRGEHAGRYRGSPHIRVLNWDYRTIRYFLRHKITRLDPEMLIRPEADGVEAWLGRTEIENEARGITEPVEDYLLRHTRLLPRDVVTLGNALCEHVSEAKAAGAHELDPAVLRRTVGETARGFADEQIRVCANQMASDQVPPRGGRHGSADFFVGSHEYSDGQATAIAGLIEEVGADRFDRAAMTRLGRRACEELQGYEHLLDVLWQNGVLGCESDDRCADAAHFYTSDTDSFHLPMDKDSYVFHPSVPHLIRMRHVGATPIRGYRKG
jgi:hypothetical protein